MSDEAHRSRASVWALVALALVAAAGMLCWGVVRARTERLAREEEARSRLEAGLQRVRVERVGRRRPLRSVVELTGTIRSARELRVLPEIAGRLSKAPAERGRAVKQGDVLAELESDTLQAQLAQAEAALSVATAALMQAEVARANARRERERLKGLEASEAVSRRDVDNAEAMLQTAEAQVQLARAQVEQARAARTVARLQLDKALIRAPFDGVVADDYGLAQGQIVSPAAPVSHLVDMAHLRVTARAGERDLPRLRGRGQKAELRVASWGGRVFPGEVLVVGPALDPATRTATVEIAVENLFERGDWLLKPGMFAQATIVAEERTQAMVLPASALTLAGGKDAVLVARPSREIHVRPDPARMRSRGVTRGQILSALGLSAGSGGRTAGALLRLPESGRGLDAVQGLALGASGVRLGDVADVAAVTVARLEAKPVELGLRAGELVEVASGLEPGELVVSSGTRLLAAGDEVEIELESGAEASE